MEVRYKVKTGIFEGPLEVLLDLIEKRKLFINDLSLASVADDYMTYIQKFEQIPIAETADFIFVAATLLLIKSKSLLPMLTLSEEEESDIALLEKRLTLYKRIRELSVSVGKIFGERGLFMPEIREITPSFLPGGSLSLALVKEATRAVIQSFPKTEFMPKAVVSKVLSLEETIEKLMKRASLALRLSFNDFASSLSREKIKESFIVSFLALLELIRRGIIDAVQNAEGGDIMLETREINTPRYDSN